MSDRCPSCKGLGYWEDDGTGGPCSRCGGKGSLPEPTKQREGDQRLPDGGMDCVQDRVIADMEESKRVGIERYGDTLHTFNGRRGFVDIHDEARDLFVYLTQMRMEAEADRETLIKVVAEALRSELPEIGEVLARRGEHIAEIAVDRIMGWVVAERQQAFDGQEFFPADHGLLVSHGQSLREDLTPEQRREAEGIAVEALRLLRDKSLAAGLLKEDWT